MLLSLSLFLFLYHSISLSLSLCLSLYIYIYIYQHKNVLKTGQVLEKSSLLSLHRSLLLHTLLALFAAVAQYLAHSANSPPITLTQASSNEIPPLFTRTRWVFWMGLEGHRFGCCRFSFCLLFFHVDSSFHL